MSLSRARAASVLACVLTVPVGSACVGRVCRWARHVTHRGLAWRARARGPQSSRAGVGGGEGAWA
eukprot:6212076-Pleurochrysis_carterae.AAC.2